MQSVLYIFGIHEIVGVGGLNISMGRINLNKIKLYTPGVYIFGGQGDRLCRVRSDRESRD
jgi:hypothetical protein